MTDRVTKETPTRDTERSGLLSIAFGVLALVGLVGLVLAAATVVGFVVLLAVVG